MVCFSPVRFGVKLTFGALALCQSRLFRRKAIARNVSFAPNRTGENISLLIKPIWQVIR